MPAWPMPRWQLHMCQWHVGTLLQVPIMYKSRCMLTRHWHWQFPLSLRTPQSGGALRGDGAVFSSRRVHCVRVRLGSDSDPAQSLRAEKILEPLAHGAHGPCSRSTLSSSGLEPHQAHKATAAGCRLALAVGASPFKVGLRLERYIQYHIHCPSPRSHHFRACQPQCPSELHRCSPQATESCGFRVHSGTLRATLLFWSKSRRLFEHRQG